MSIIKLSLVEMSILDNNSIGTSKNYHFWYLKMYLWYQISKMAFLLLTITFMITEIKIVTSKNWIIDIKNEHCY